MHTLTELMLSYRKHQPNETIRLFFVFFFLFQNFSISKVRFKILFINPFLDDPLLCQTHCCYSISDDSVHWFQLVFNLTVDFRIFQRDSMHDYFFFSFEIHTFTLNSFVFFILTFF